MPTYSEKQFQKDLKELNALIGSFKKGGSSCGKKMQEDFMMELIDLEIINIQILL